MGAITRKTRTEEMDQARARGREIRQAERESSQREAALSLVRHLIREGWELAKIEEAVRSGSLAPWLGKDGDK